MSDAHATLLVELFTEELPPKALARLGEAFSQAVAEGLRTRGLLGSKSVATTYATPRRLGVSISEVLRRGVQTTQAQKLMPVAVAFSPDGRPTEPLRRKLAALGLDESLLERGVRRLEGKTETLFVERIVPGMELPKALQQALDEAIAHLPIPKVMSYASRGAYFSDVKFVRPAHRLVALHGTDVVRVRALGLEGGRITLGHRFLSRGEIELASADAYAPTLEAEGKVLPSFAARRSAIVEGLRTQAQGALVLMPDSLLDEVTALVEWPVVLAGNFDQAFLDVPQECLILTMQQNQKYFALADAKGRLTNRFLVVSNLATSDPSAIVRGNERVLRARLADAKFFYDQDRKRPLDEWVEKLASVVYHNKLGSQGQRAARLRKLSGEVADLIGTHAKVAERAGWLAKADLVTDMVGEFPELQGTMGRYYALNDGEPPEVADAIAQHYWPRFAGDALPEHRVAMAVALAEKLEALAGLFGIGEVPTGEKDPFGLRRAALGVIRIVIERAIHVSLNDLVGRAFASFAEVPGVTDKRDPLIDFIHERLRGYLREQGYSANQVSAVLEARPDAINDLPARLAAVVAFESLPEAAALAAANKRIVNILRKSDEATSLAVDPARLTDPAEQELARMFERLAPEVDADCARGSYTAALQVLAAAKPAVDRFFDQVMVMVDDPALRANRIALLRTVAQTMNRVADISKLAT